MILVSGAVALLILNGLFMARLLVLSSAQSVMAKAPTMTTLAYILTLLCIWAIYKCSVSDPGYVPQSLSKLSVRNYCNNCKAPKPKRAHHCRRCNRCVHRMDHHCVWINNCVGYKNQKFFILFLTYLVILGVYDCVLICYHSFTSFSIHGLPSLAMTLVMFIFFALNLGTAIYAGIYLREQLESVETNTTLVETYQGTRGDPEANVFVQLFGERKFLWFLPVHSSLPPNYYEEVLGTEKLRPRDADILGVSNDYKPVRDIDKID